MASTFSGSGVSGGRPSEGGHMASTFSGSDVIGSRPSEGGHMASTFSGSDVSGGRPSEGGHMASTFFGSDVRSTRRARDRQPFAYLEIEIYGKTYGAYIYIEAEDAELVCVGLAQARPKYAQRGGHFTMTFAYNNMQTS